MRIAARRTAAALTCAWLVSAALTACGTRAASDRAAGGCLRTVHGVVSGRSTLAARWLPQGFGRPRTSSAALPSMVFERAGHDRARLQLVATLHRGPLRRADTAGRSFVRSVLVSGRHALVGSGAPDPRFIGVYWKPDPGYLLSIGGFGLPEQVVVRIARHVSFDPASVVSLPVDPGPVVTRKAAIVAAERSARLAPGPATAKLSSWTEISALLPGREQVPPQLRTTPWRPVWAVVLARPSGQRSLVVLDARSGKALAALAAGAWFSALTDRAAVSGCPGGSSARVPFGVLTRTEASYPGRPPRGPPGRHAPHAVMEKVRLVLSTVPAVNQAAPGLYGGCVQQSCSIRQLVWVRITMDRALGRRLLSCLPPSVSVPAGYHPTKVRRTFSVDVPDNEEIGCGPLPKRIAELRDLAPAAS